MAEIPKEKPHLFVDSSPQKPSYTALSTGSRGFRLPLRDRKKHAEILKQQLDKALAQALQNRKDSDNNPAAVLKTADGFLVEFESDAGFPLKLDSLDKLQSGIELRNVRRVTVQRADDRPIEKTVATVFVPFGKLPVLQNLVERYVSETTKDKEGNLTDTPKHREFIESIAAVRLATLSALWTDTEPMPKTNDSLWWEVWLRSGKNSVDPSAMAAFRLEAERLGIQIFGKPLSFPEQTVQLILASVDQLAASVILLNSLAELRRAKETAAFFMRATPTEQQQWVDDAVKRIASPPSSAVAVCLLDTGVNAEHRLLKLAIANGDTQAYRDEWTAADNHGHGTEMAGLALYGDLFDLLRGSHSVQLLHRLESVKVLPNAGENPRELYGTITAACVAKAEYQAASRRRAFCLTVTTPTFGIAGSHRRGPRNSISCVRASVSQTKLSD
jgi:hypothetical protein